MNFYETRYVNYLNKTKKASLHPKLKTIYDSLPNKIEDLPNMIFYGPSGVGKYSQVLYSIYKYSQSQLKYEKKMNIKYNKDTYCYKISDIHYEIDMQLLGCNSKLLWNEIYNNIVDIISTKKNKTGIIVCKYFHEIHSELLDCFYSYMQKSIFQNINIKFILITENISFISNNIRKCCLIVSCPRPYKTTYEKCLEIKLKDSYPVNIKQLILSEKQNIKPYKNTCDNIISNIINIDNLKYSELRQILYNLLIYNYNLGNCIFYILSELIKKKLIKKELEGNLMMETYYFLKYFNNNYRPIYHLENYILYLIKIIYEL